MSAAGMHGTSSPSTGSDSRGQTGRLGGGPGGDASGTGPTESGSSYTTAVDTSSLSGIEAASRRPATNDSGGTTADNLAASPTTAEQLASSSSVLDSLTPQSQRPRPSEPTGWPDSQSAFSTPAQNPTSASAPSDNLTQELSDNDALYSLPATPGNSVQEQDNPSSSATTADVSNPQAYNNDTATHQGNQTPIVAAGVATTAPTGWSIGGLWQGIAGVGQWVLNNGVRPLATAAGATAGAGVSGALAMVYPRPLGGTHVVELVGSDGMSVHIAADASVSVYQNGVLTGIPASLHPGMVVSVGGIGYQVEGSQASITTGNTAEPGPGSSAVPLQPPVHDPGAIDISIQVSSPLATNHQQPISTVQSSIEDNDVTSLPEDFVGVQDDKSDRQGNRQNNGPLSPDHGGTGDAEADFGILGGDAGYDVIDDGQSVATNGVRLRPATETNGPRIDIPANGNKPHETLHYR